MPQRCHRHRVRLTAAAAAATLCVFSFAAVAAQAADTIEFSTTRATQPINLGPPVKLGVEAKVVKFKTNRHDRAALRGVRAAAALRRKSAAQVRIGTVANDRMAAIQSALDEAQGNEDALSEEIMQRAVDRYQGGSSADLAFLLSGSSLSGLIDRSKVLHDQSSQDAQLVADYAFTTARLEELRQVLDDIAQTAGERADNLNARADRAEDSLVAARTVHQQSADTASRAPVENEGGVDSKTGATTANGTWYVMDGAFQAQLYLPSTASSYDGGSTNFPAQPATPQQIATVLSDPRIQLDASGIHDIQTHQIDGRLLQAMELGAEQFHFLRVTALKGDHGTYTASGNVSEHSFGCAMDIGTVGTTYITPSSQTSGGEVEQAVRFFAGLGQIAPVLAPHQVISLFDLGGATMALGDHGDHIHVGYHC
ncbi:MAG: Lytic transglycosylase catalytic [Thermoleophilia bacterium]|nr:Lytic transglycosylase catalytic [Thermoleophilia bacterium]